MSTLTATPAVTARRGFDSLEAETHLDASPCRARSRPGFADR